MCASTRDCKLNQLVAPFSPTSLQVDVYEKFNGHEDFEILHLFGYFFKIAHGELQIYLTVLIFIVGLLTALFLHARAHTHTLHIMQTSQNIHVYMHVR